jgi:hypothetical protein
MFFEVTATLRLRFADYSLRNRYGGRRTESIAQLTALHREAVVSYLGRRCSREWMKP